MSTQRSKYTAEGSQPVTFRFTPDELESLEVLAGHLMRQRAGNVTPKVSRAEVVRHALAGLLERAAQQIAADHSAWAALVGIGGETAMLTLHGEGQGEPLPEVRTRFTTPDGREAVHVMPTRWAKLEVTAKIDGQPIDLPLIVEEPETSDFAVEVFLTDQDGTARVYLGSLSRRIAESHHAYFDNRLYRIADELGLRG